MTTEFSPEEFEKTERPTPRRIQEAMQQGQLLISREISSFVLLAIFTIFISWMLPTLLHYAKEGLAKYIANAYSFEYSDPDLISELLYNVMLQICMISAAPLIVILSASILGNILQTRFVITLSSLRLDFNKVSFITGIQRLLSVRFIIEYTKNFLKLSCIIAVAYIIIAAELPLIYQTPSFAIHAALSLTLRCLVKLLVGVSIAMGLLAILDYLYERHFYLKSLMMTKSELKEELRHTEGNPEIKGKLRSMQNSRRFKP